MPGWVLADSTSVDGRFYGVGTVPPPDVAASIGEHLRRYVDDVLGSPVVEVTVPAPEPIALADEPGDGSAMYTGPVPETPVVPEEPAEPVAPEDVEPAPGSESLTPAPEEESTTVEEAGPRTPVGSPPARGGKGSGLDLWLAYARANDVEVTEDMERGEVIEACRLAGLPVD